MVRSLPVLMLLLIGVCAAAPVALGGDPLPPPSLAGQLFAITFLTEKGKPHDKLAFTTDGASSVSLGAGTIKVAYKYSGKGKVVEFSGTFTDAKGTVTELTGSVSGSDIHGTIVTTAKDDDPQARNFNGTRLAKN